VSTKEREFERHSFIVKIWLEEEVETGPGQMKWRGHITHVVSQERRYVERLQDITSFIGGFLAAMGARLDAGEEQAEG
jgi:hypothetical protein